ncbi:MAG: TetR/AcrR family transcriptional regulator [Gemmatimonadales bacterium]
MSQAPSDWIRAATAAMRKGGVEAIRVEALARDLGVTKGSFYWHFRDRKALLEGLLRSWEEETHWLIREAARADTPRDRFRRFFELATGSAYPPDFAIFAWARTSRAVAARVQAVEEVRIGFFAKQFRSAGFPAKEARRRAAVGYAATLGFLERNHRTQGTAGSFRASADEVFDILLEAPGNTAGAMD